MHELHRIDYLAKAAAVHVLKKHWVSESYHDFDPTFLTDFCFLRRKGYLGEAIVTARISWNSFSVTLLPLEFVLPFFPELLFRLFVITVLIEALFALKLNPYLILYLPLFWSQLKQKSRTSWGLRLRTASWRGSRTGITRSFMYLLIYSCFFKLSSII